MLRPSTRVGMPALGMALRGLAQCGPISSSASRIVLGPTQQLKPRTYEHIARIEENPAISAKMDEQQGADRTWFEAHPQRTLHLRKARAWERLPDDGFANATLVIKIAWVRDSNPPAFEKQADPPHPGRVDRMAQCRRKRAGRSTHPRNPHAHAIVANVLRECWAAILPSSTTQRPSADIAKPPRGRGGLNSALAA